MFVQERKLISALVDNVATNTGQPPASNFTPNQMVAHNIPKANIATFVRKQSVRPNFEWIFIWRHTLDLTFPVQQKTDVPAVVQLKFDFYRENERRTHSNRV